MMFARLEEEIIGLEEELETLRASMELPESYLDPGRMRALQAREQEIQSQLAAAYERWQSWS